AAPARDRGDRLVARAASGGPGGSAHLPAQSPLAGGGGVPRVFVGRQSLALDPADPGDGGDWVLAPPRSPGRGTGADGRDPAAGLQHVARFSRTHLATLSGRTAAPGLG